MNEKCTMCGFELHRQRCTGCGTPMVNQNNDMPITEIIDMAHSSGFKEGSRASKWIRIEDNTPPPGTYITYDNYTVRESTLWEAGDWTYEESYEAHQELIPTHWMPLPQPPEVNDGDDIS